uniref:Uncharacterized protein n=1 Tax=Magallana gigas TaxID=29159 RepID=A0A8W8IRN7_MAGGI
MMGNVSIGLDSGICSNISNGDPLACCRNYRIVDTSCEECPPGSFGIDCLDKCPPQFYGRFCREKCSCDPCDKITGCLKVTTMNTTRVSKEDGLCVNVSNGEALECCPNYRYAGCSCDVNDQMRNCSDNTIQESYHLKKKEVDKSCYSKPASTLDMIMCEYFNISEHVATLMNKLY